MCAASVCPAMLTRARSASRARHTGTFLPVPPQYCIDCLPGGDGVPIQRVLVPLVYAVMHTALLSLGLLPIPMCRGLLRDLLGSQDRRGWFPVEDGVWMHKVFGAAMLGALLLAPLLWLVAMGASCLGTATDSELARAKACTAFAPPIVDAVEGPIPEANNVSLKVQSPAAPQAARAALELCCDPMRRGPALTSCSFGKRCR